MATMPKYRLELVLEQRERAKNAAEKALKDAREALEVEEQKLAVLEEEKARKLAEIDSTREKRDSKAAEGKLSVELSRQYKLFIKRLHEEIKEIDLRVYKQARAVTRAEEIVEQKKDNLLKCAKEYEAMCKHRENWLEGVKSEMRKQEQNLMEEIGMGQFFKRRKGGL